MDGNGGSHTSATESCGELVLIRLIVYLVEGILTILFSGVVFFVLPDYPKYPRSRTWLTEREREREQEYLDIPLSENAPRTSDDWFNKQELLPH